MWVRRLGWIRCRVDAEGCVGIVRTVAVVRGAWARGCVLSGGGHGGDVGGRRQGAGGRRGGGHVIAWWGWAVRGFERQLLGHPFAGAVFTDGVALTTPQLLML